MRRKLREREDDFLIKCAQAARYFWGESGVASVTVKPTWYAVSDIQTTLNVYCQKTYAMCMICHRHNNHSRTRKRTRGDSAQSDRARRCPHILVHEMKY